METRTSGASWSHCQAYDDEGYPCPTDQRPRADPFGSYSVLCSEEQAEQQDGPFSFAGSHWEKHYFAAFSDGAVGKWSCSLCSERGARREGLFEKGRTHSSSSSGLFSLDWFQWSSSTSSTCKIKTPEVGDDSGRHYGVCPHTTAPSKRTSSSTSRSQQLGWAWIGGVCWETPWCPQQGLGQDQIEGEKLPFGEDQAGYTGWDAGG